MLYYSFCKEPDLKSCYPPGYTNKIAKSGVIRIVDENRNNTERYTQLVEEAPIQRNVQVVNRENRSTSFQCSEGTNTVYLIIQRMKSQQGQLKIQFLIFQFQVKLFFEVIMKLV